MATKLKSKQIQKLKKVIKKLKKAKKKRASKSSGIEQRVNQKVIINGSSGGNNPPQVLQQHIPSSDTEFLRSVIQANNSNPLGRPVVSRVPYKPMYDLGDQYGLNLTSEFNANAQPTMGVFASSNSMDSLPTAPAMYDSDFLKPDYYEEVPYNNLKPAPQPNPKFSDKVEDPPPIDIKPKRTRGLNKTPAQRKAEFDEQERKRLEREQKRIDKLNKDIKKQFKKGRVEYINSQEDSEDSEDGFVTDAVHTFRTPNRTFAL